MDNLFSPVEPGNLELGTRVPATMPDGSMATVRSMGIGDDGRETLIPTVSPGGQLLDNQAAIDLYRRTGQHLGRFKTPEESNIYAEALHQQQERMYGKK